MLDSIAPTLLEVRGVALAVPHRFEHGVEAHGKILHFIANRQPEDAERAMAESREVWESMSGEEDQTS